MRRRGLGWGLFVIVATWGCECMDQYNPRPHWKNLAKERKLAHNSSFKLTEEGKIPQLEEKGTTKELPEVERNFASYCATCHGADGKAQSPAAMALNPRPRSFLDKKWQSEVTDEHIYNVIKNGGAANGLSASMAAWGAVLSDEQIKELVKKIRSYGQQSD